MGEEQVKLIGAWPSPFYYRVLWALKIKGIPFEYIEEDLKNKSELLLQYNPIHKKIPVLVHNGKPICESMVILEYLEETWPHSIPLMPNDPYDRAFARFWIKFIEDKGSWWTIYRTAGEEQEKGVKELSEILKTIEEHALIDSSKKYFCGDELTMLDIAYGGIAIWLETLEECGDVKVFDPHHFPKLHNWTKTFKEHPVIKENMPDCDKMLAVFKRRREMVLAGKA